MPTKREKSSLLLFLKEPRLGRVKTRIAAVLGQQAALELYKCFVLDELDMIDITGLECYVCVHPPESVTAVAAWLDGKRRFLPQHGTDLGERMAQAFRAIFAEGSERGVLIGSDLPDLPAQILHEAMASLEREDAVIGPARDGGYYLIGFRRERFAPEVFRGMAWGGPDILERTRELLRRSELSVHILPGWQDADTVDDLHDLLARNRATPIAAKRTVRFLETLVSETPVTEEPDA
jgi:rSAM/selenodomain-associated transferase 1